MRLYGAIDLHSNNGVLVVMNEMDQVVCKRRLPNTLPVVLGALEPYREQLEGIAVESTFNWYWLVDGLQEAGYQVHLVNTAAVKIYEGLKHSEDEDDARHLAHLLRLGILPEGYIYPKEDRAIRDLLRKRSQLVRHRAAHVKSIQTLAQRNNAQELSVSAIEDLSEQDIEALCLDPNRTLAMRSSWKIIAELTEEVTQIEKTVLAQVRWRSGFKSLLTVHGIGKILALTIVLETGDITRFKEVGHYASYCRCVQSNRWSNGKKKGEGNRKNGNKYLGWAYMEAAEFAKRFNERIRRFYQRKTAQRNPIVARKAIAHKLSRACYYVMRDEVPFDVTRAFA